jgi:zinc transport system ATP-binding protein
VTAPLPDRAHARVVEARDLHVTLGTSHILRGIDLDVHDGEVVALLGANGSGKSTLVRTLVGILPSTQGSVHLFGTPLGRQVPWTDVGYVPQRVSAGTGVPSTAAEVTSSGLLHGRRLRLPRDWWARTMDALDQVGLADLADRSVNELSGGQQQRVLIARALVRRPDLLLLDEPVAGVDLPSQRAFADALGALAAEGTTVLVVLHELGALAPLVQRAVVLRHGAVVHDGAPPSPSAEHAGPDHDHVHPHDDDRDVTGHADAALTARVGWDR